MALVTARKLFFRKWRELVACLLSPPAEPICEWRVVDGPAPPTAAPKQPRAGASSSARHCPFGKLLFTRKNHTASLTASYQSEKKGRARPGPQKSGGISPCLSRRSDCDGQRHGSPTPVSVLPHHVRRDLTEGTNSGPRDEDIFLDYRSWLTVITRTLPRGRGSDRGAAIRVT